MVPAAPEVCGTAIRSGPKGADQLSVEDERDIAVERDPQKCGPGIEDFDACEACAARTSDHEAHCGGCPLEIERG